MINLKGAVISLVIGLLVYFLIIRLLLVKKNENGQKEYVDLWPSKLDLEDLVYKPIIFSYKNKGVYNVVSYAVIFVVRALSETLDAIVYFFRRYILRQYKYKFDGSPFTFKLGRKLDQLKHNDNFYFAYRLLEKRIIVKNVNDTLNSTFAFDFLMACIGVVVVLILMIV